MDFSSIYGHFVWHQDNGRLLAFMGKKHHLWTQINGKKSIKLANLYIFPNENP